MDAHPNQRDVYDARRRIAAVVQRTPLRRSAWLGSVAGGSVHLKLECVQQTGSFKLRGAANTLLTMSQSERARGVVTVSSGNHGRAVAHVADLLGIAATICVSSRVPGVKLRAIEALGAKVVIAGPDQDAADAEARRLAAGGVTFVHPFDDPLVIAGQGTIGLEILDDLPGVGQVIVPLSGGGLIAGIAAAVKGADPTIIVTGVSQERGPAMYRSLAAGGLTDVDETDTLADALAGSLGPENHHTFAMCRELVDEVVLVSESEIAAAMMALMDKERLVVEGGGAVGVAAILAGKIEPIAPTVVVLSGGNIAPETLRAVLDGRGTTMEEAL